MNERPRTPRVTIFSLGGTIAATRADSDAVGGAVTPRLGVEELIDAVPLLRGVAELDAVAFRQVPSGDITLADLVELAGEISRRFDEGTAGVVVIQGTDTIEETSFALDVLLRGERPVVVTGAMRNPTMAGADGPANLLAAVQVASSAEAGGLGTVVVFDDEIHAARFVRKMHSSSTGALRSPSAGPIGWVSEGRCRVVMRLARLKGPIVGPAAVIPPVALLTASVGDDMGLLAHVEASGYAGLVVEAFGAGHVPARVVARLGDLATRIPVVLATRTGAGEVLQATYGFPGSERDLISRGLIPAGFLDGPKARVLLSLVLSARPDLDAVRRSFATFNASVGVTTGPAGR